jgi:hypothetical protein
MTHHLFSTKSFVPGHVVGTAILLFGTIAIAKGLIARQETAVREYERGQYGKKCARDQLARQP